MARDFHRITLSAPACEPGSRSADGCRRSTRLSDLGMRVDFPGGWKAPRGAACLANRAAFAHCPVVRAFSAWELPDSRATVLVDCVVFCRGHSAHGRDPVEASAAERNDLGIMGGVHLLHADDSDLSLWREVDKWQVGIDGS